MWMPQIKVVKRQSAYPNHIAALPRRPYTTTTGHTAL